MFSFAGFLRIYSCFINSHATEVPFCFESKLLMATPCSIFTNEEQKRLAGDVRNVYMDATHVRNVHQSFVVHNYTMHNNKMFPWTHRLKKLHLI